MWDAAVFDMNLLQSAKIENDHAKITPVDLWIMQVYTSGKAPHCATSCKHLIGKLAALAAATAVIPVAYSVPALCIGLA